MFPSWVIWGTVPIGLVIELLFRPRFSLRFFFSFLWSGVTTSGVTAVIKRGDIEVVINVFKGSGDIDKGDGIDGNDSDSIQVSNKYGKHKKHPFRGQPMA